MDLGTVYVICMDWLLETSVWPYRLVSLQYVILVLFISYYSYFWYFVINSVLVYSLHTLAYANYIDSPHCCTVISMLNMLIVVTGFCLAKE